MNDYDDEPQFHNPSYDNNRLLNANRNDQYVRSGGGPSVGNRGLAPRRDLGPLIEEEPDVSDPDLAMSLGMPKLQEMANAKKHAAARRIFNTAMHNKRAANPWTKLGQQTEANVQNMFGEATPRVQGFGKLFGRKAGNFRAAEREKRPKLGFFGRLKRAVMGDPDAPKRTWMERLFGARKKSKALTSSEKGAFAAQRSGGSWTDALAPLNADGSAKWENWQDEEKAAGSVVQIDDKVPAQAQAKAQVDEESSLESQELPQQQFIEEEEKEPFDNQTIDDNSIDNDDDEDNDYISPAERFAMEETQQRMMRNRYN